MSLPDLKGRTAVITGASRGIGAAMARVFAEHGLQLGLCARGDSALEASDSVLTAHVDVSDEAAVDSFTAQVTERFGVIDLWVNNAGVLDPIQPIRSMAVEDFRRHIDINLTGAFIGMRAYIRHVREQGQGGVLINISSGAAWKGYAGWGPYCAGKSGLARLTDCAVLEEEASGLRAHSVAPGVVDTDMQAMIRASTEDAFPEVERFKQLKRDEGFNSADYVARELLAIAFDPDRRTDETAISIEPEES